MRAVKMITAALAATTLMSVAVGVPAASASGGSATMELASVQFPGGTTVPGTTSGSVNETPGTTVKLSVPDIVPDTANPLDEYEFMFWDVNGTITTAENTSFTAPAAGTTFDAYAWYALTSSGPGGGTPALSTWAFSAPQNEVISGTPIASATSGWTSGSQTVLTADAPSVTAKQHFAPPGTSVKQQLLYPPFIKWLSFFGTDVTTSGTDGITLNVAANESPYAIAFYGAGTGVTICPPPSSSPTCT